MKQEIIRSTQNPIVKFVASLKEKKFREREGLFLVEGRKMVTEGFARGADIQTVYATEKFLGVFPEEKTVYVSEEVFRKMSMFSTKLNEIKFSFPFLGGQSGGLRSPLREAGSRRRTPRCRHRRTRFR